MRLDVMVGFYGKVFACPANMANEGDYGRKVGGERLFGDIFQPVIG